MTYVTHPETFHGLPVRVYDKESVGRPLPGDPAASAWRLEIEDRDPPEYFAELFGCFEPNLRALFVGDLEQEQREVSFIEHGDLTPLVEALPALEVLTVRGSGGMRLGPLRHSGLRELVLEAAGLPAVVVRGVAASDLPGLRHLELWLGEINRGGDAEVADLGDILTGARLPALTRLGLRNWEIADEAAAELAAAPVVARLEVLDLSLGLLGDEGAQALLAGQPLGHLAELNLEYHRMSEAMAARIVAALPDVAVNVDEPLGDDENDHIVAVDE